MAENNDKEVKKKTKDRLDKSEKSGDVGQEMSDLTRKLDELDQKREEALAIAQRAQADYVNLKRRFDKEREEISKFASEMVLLQMLPAIDNLDRAIHYANEEEQSSSLFTGVKMTLQQMHDALEAMGMSRVIVNAGDNFDPNIHEAIEVVDGDKDKVVEILQTGYKVGDRVVRAAKVKVGGGAVTE